MASLIDEENDAIYYLDKQGMLDAYNLSDLTRKEWGRNRYNADEYGLLEQDADHLYVATDSFLAKLKKDDGSEIWKVGNQMVSFEPQAELLLRGDELILLVDSQSRAKYSIEDGRVLAEFKNSRYR